MADAVEFVAKDKDGRLTQYLNGGVLKPCLPGAELRQSWLEELPELLLQRGRSPRWEASIRFALARDARSSTAGDRYLRHQGVHSRLRISYEGYRSGLRKKGESK